MSLLKKIGKVAGGAIGGPIGAAIGGAAGSLLSGHKAKKAAGVQSGAYQAAADAQKASLDRITSYQQPYRDAGTGAVNDLMKVNSGDYSAFETSPDFLFAQKYGGQAVDRSAAARGGLNSGNTLIAQQKFGQGLASQQLGQYRNSLFQTAGIGQNANNQLTGADLATTETAGKFVAGAGDARASGIINNANGQADAIDQILGGGGVANGNALIKRKPVAGANSLYGYNLRQRPIASTAAV